MATRTTIYSRTNLALSVEETEEQLEHHDLLVGEQNLTGRGVAKAAFSREGRRSHHPLFIGQTTRERIVYY